MRLLRSWPNRVPPGRNHVVDDIERLIISNHCYRPLGDIDDDVLLLEWDIAVDIEDLYRFADVARRAPHRVLVAPYRLPDRMYGLPAPVWAHRRWDGTGTGTVSPVGAKPVETGDPTCDLFGLGMVYLPRALIHGYLRSGWSSHFGDVEFSMWHHVEVGQPVPITWDIRPVHVNYIICWEG